MKLLISGISSILNFFSMSKEIRVAKRVIRSFQLKSVRKSKKYILIEAFQTPSNRLGLSIFAPTASKFYKAKLVAFYMMPVTPLKFLKEQIRFFFSVEKSFGCSRFIFFGSKNSREYEVKAQDLLKSVSNLKELETLEYQGIVIGDLIYDVYLRKFRKPTIDLTDFGLVEVTSLFLQHFDQLYKRFVKEEVAGVCVSHTVYLLGLPSRIAAFFGVPAFQVTGESIYRITLENTHAYTAFKQYPELFRSLPKEVQIEGKKTAKKRLEMRFAGYVGVDMHYSTVSAYSSSENSVRILRQNSKPHILIAIHDFYDSPHSYGLNLYPDFYQWLLALAEISRKTDYNWYIKTHPDIRGEGHSVIQAFIAENPQFSLISPSTSHHQLIKEGISLALTIFGSIAMEYPYLGKPVINASLNNCHVRYNFSISPKSSEEYENLLMNLDLIQAPDDQESILEYYFIHNLFMLKSWTIRDYDLYFKSITNTSSAHSWAFFQYFKFGNNSYELYEILVALDNFFNDEVPFLSPMHFALINSSDLTKAKEELAAFDVWDI
jgi:hypothetical protein